MTRPPAPRRPVPCRRTARRDPPRCERKFAPARFDDLSADGVFCGCASIFGAADLGGDLVEPGAFAGSLARRGAAGVKLLFQHDPAEPIGVWDEIVEDARGLRVRGRLMPEVARAREVLALMRAGALDGLSIGFRPVKARTDPRTGIRRLIEVDLWEISIVTFPMLPEARIGEVKRLEQAALAAIRRATALVRAG
ncbi:hypothetical protein EDC22_11661 [Tepidamorphus gemmatus]|uniref:Prohead serine protease domain-containing protein n=1 Tax=Tepidamorphus gemmatus TaxID=747076 RepID=A0A4R3LZG9_9HYPH|nr:HK97 family phage prohead protease [Tepidamorphus gemmatus]TCT04185.1 hypothetical protein EDC22_11661 [Tepidamorphus gemmatus]